MPLFTTRAIEDFPIGYVPLREHLMKWALCLGCASLLSSCSVVRYFEWTPTFDKPTAKDISGTYAVQKVSWLVPQRKSLKGISLHLSKDGSYRLEGMDRNPSSPLVPAREGKWSLEPRRGLALGSMETWAVRFTLPDEKFTSAWCLEASTPYRLLFQDHLKPSNNRFLILKKVSGAAAVGRAGSSPSP